MSYVKPQFVDSPNTAAQLNTEFQKVYDQALADGKVYADGKVTAGDTATLASAATYTDAKVAAIPPPPPSIITPRAWLPAVAPTAVVGAWVWAPSTTQWFGGSLQSSGAQNDEASYDVLLQAGTYELALFHRRSPNAGIYTVSVDGVDVGTIDGYLSAQDSRRDALAGLVVASSGVHTVRLKMATKNPSAAAYYAIPNALSLIRVG